MNLKRNQDLIDLTSENKVKNFSDQQILVNQRQKRSSEKSTPIPPRRSRSAPERHNKDQKGSVINNFA